VRLGAAALGLALFVGAAHADGDGRPVTIEGRLFQPDRLVALVGETVTWTNVDPLTHTVTADDETFDSGDLAPDAAFSVTFDKPGRHTYLCTIHRYMRGEVDVFSVALEGPQRVIRSAGQALLRGLAPPGAGTVVIQRLPRQGPPVQVAAVTPAADGSFRDVVRPRATARYRALVGALSSPVVKIQVSARLDVDVARRGDEVILHAEASPPQPLAPVELQVYGRELFTFVRAARGRLDRHSQATFTLHPRQALHIRIALIRGARGLAPAVSKVIVVRPRS
jgi:plastocyanin